MQSTTIYSSLSEFLGELTDLGISYSQDRSILSLKIVCIVEKTLPPKEFSFTHGSSDTLSTRSVTLSTDSEKFFCDLEDRETLQDTLKSLAQEILTYSSDDFSVTISLSSQVCPLNQRTS